MRNCLGNGMWPLVSGYCSNFGVPCSIIVQPTTVKTKSLSQSDSQAGRKFGERVVVRGARNYTTNHNLQIEEELLLAPSDFSLASEMDWELLKLQFYLGQRSSRGRGGKDTVITQQTMAGKWL